jgi:uncharacterized protein (DUF1697 family)
MAVFIILFRGVGGTTQLPTAQLRAALLEAGFWNVATYINSGNAVLASDLDRDHVRGRVAAVANEKLGFTKAVLVMTGMEWAGLIAANPFPEAVTEPRTLHAFALAAEPAEAAVAALRAKASPTERVAVKGRVMYLHASDGFGRSKLPPLVDRTLGVTTTARNWNTVLALEALAKQAATP